MKYVMRCCSPLLLHGDHCTQHRFVQLGRRTDVNAIFSVADKISERVGGRRELIHEDPRERHLLRGKDAHLDRQATIKGQQSREMLAASKCLKA